VVVYNSQAMFKAMFKATTEAIFGREPVPKEVFEKRTDEQGRLYMIVVGKTERSYYL
jgi:hypothetical protein